jgi:hypothetical protein
MTQPAAKAEKDIQSLLLRVIEHEVKMGIAEKVDARFGSSFQTRCHYWQKEIEKFWREIVEMNRTRSRRRGQFFSDDEIGQWKQELTKQGIRLAVNRLMEDLQGRGIEADARWLSKVAEELYD